MISSGVNGFNVDGLQLGTLFRPSVSVGVGIAARFTSFKLEINYGLPLIAHLSDALKPGLQFGLGMEFM